MEMIIRHLIYIFLHKYVAILLDESIPYLKEILCMPRRIGKSSKYFLILDICPEDLLYLGLSFLYMITHGDVLE